MSEVEMGEGARHEKQKTDRVYTSFEGAQMFGVLGINGPGMISLKQEIRLLGLN